MNRRQKKKLLKKYLIKELALVAAYNYFADRHPPVVLNGIPLMTYMTVRASMINNEYQKKMYGKVLYPSLGRVCGRHGKQYVFTMVRWDASKVGISEPPSSNKKKIAIELWHLERLIQISKCIYEKTKEVGSNV